MDSLTFSSPFDPSLLRLEGSLTDLGISRRAQDSLWSTYYGSVPVNRSS